MLKICFVCLGNICRSPMAEFIMKSKVNDNDYLIESRATSYEEQGNDIYPPAKKKLDEEHIPYTRHYATRLEKEDYDKYDIFYCMEESNISSCIRIFGSDKDNKIKKLLPRDIADPWYTNNFDITYNDLVEGIDELLKQNKRVSN